MRDFLDKLIQKTVTVITSVGLLHGKLVNYDISLHGGFGSLVLDSQQGPVLILRWIAIGR